MSNDGCSCRGANLTALDRFTALPFADIVYGEKCADGWVVRRGCGPNTPVFSEQDGFLRSMAAFHVGSGVSRADVETAIASAQPVASGFEAAVYSTASDCFAALLGPRSVLASDILAAESVSLAHAATNVVLEHGLLRACSRRGCSQSIFEPSVESLARLVGRRVLDAALRVSLNVAAPELYDLCCDVAVAEYEGRSNEATIIFGLRGDPNAPAPALAFTRPVETWERAGVRKLIEMASDNFALLFDGRAFYGFATLTHRPAGAFLRIMGHGVWAVHQGARIAALISHGIPVERQRILSFDIFQSYLSNIFPAMSDGGVRRLWEIVTVAAEQTVGTNILFSGQAAVEAARLARQCIPVMPTVLTPELTRRLTSIDGTVIVDTDGAVHAVGAILDGRATAEGTWQRGGRYNSAANFVTSCSAPCFILIVSQDRYIDVVPPVEAGDSAWTMRRYLKLSSTAI
jgi:hypothetical protein